jgi:hypothetical protein
MCRKTRHAFAAVAYGIFPVASQIFLDLLDSALDAPVFFRWIPAIYC